MNSVVLNYADAFRNLRVYTESRPVRREALNKPCMLLAVIDAIQAGVFNNNEIYYEPYLLECYDRYFDLTCPDRERRAYYPFYYLKSDGFWNLHSKIKGKFKKTPSHRSISEEVKFASLNDDLFKCLRNSQNCDYFRKVIIDRWFPNQEDKIWEATGETRQSTVDQAGGIQREELDFLKHKLVTEKWIKRFDNRHPLFRQCVLEAYNNQCAMTGWKLRTGKRSSLLEAAHIMPLKERLDNRVNNGIALSPTVHKAMDAHLIAPGPSKKASNSPVIWHVSQLVNKQKTNDLGAKWLSEFHHSPVLLPEDVKLHPCNSVLEWRMSSLLK